MQYLPLCSIALQHGFYVNDVAKGLSLMPTPYTTTLFRRYNLLWRADGSNYILYYAKKTNLIPALANADHLTTLQFILRSDHPYFFNITDAPFEKISTHKFHLHNRRAYTGVESPFSLAKGNIVADDDLSTPNTNLRPNDELGLVEITLGLETNGQWLPLPVRDADAAPPTPRSYHIAFKARKTHWRYYVVDRTQPDSQFDLDSMKVTATTNRLTTGNGTQEGHEFIKQDELHKIKGSDQNAVVLFSKSAFPLQERPGLKTELALKKKSTHSSNGNTPLTIDLPMPDWRRIAPERQGTDLQIFSDMYVYL